MVRDGFVYAPKTSGELVCLEAATGKVMWEEGRVTDLKSGASIHLTPNGKRVFVYTDRGELICARLESEGYKEQGRAKLLEPTFPNGGRKVAWAVPAYADGCVFVRNQREMVCVSLIEKR
jgi:outer membrane protein assembly factor BamB